MPSLGLQTAKIKVFSVNGYSSLSSCPSSPSILKPPSLYPLLYSILILSLRVFHFVPFSACNILGVILFTFAPHINFKVTVSAGFSKFPFLCLQPVVPKTAAAKKNAQSRIITNRLPPPRILFYTFFMSFHSKTSLN